MTKKNIKVDLEVVDFYGDLNKSIKQLQDYKEKYSKDYFHLHLDGNMESYPYCDDQHYVIQLVGLRLETDEECAERVQRDEQMKTKYEALERQKFEELRQKYEGK